MSVRIIKAHTTPSETASDSYNFVDLKRQSEDILSSARREADEIVAKAREEYDQVRSEAIQDGRNEGLLQAEQKLDERANEIAEQRVSARLTTALPALRAAAESLQAERDGWLIRWEQVAVRLGVAIAEKLIQRQLTITPDIAVEMISNALRLAAGQPQMTVYLHPEDLAAWGDRASQIIQSLTACADTTLVPDHQASRGGCRIETRHGEIDARVETMLHRIAEELLQG
jgi:flagellar assembly protein FliH